MKQRSVNAAPIAIEFVLLLVVPFSIAIGQVPPDTLTVGVDEDAFLESIDDGDGDATQLTELLQSLKDNPFDINTATAEALAEIPSLGFELAQQIVRYRNDNGPFGSVPELQMVRGVSEFVFVHARPYLSIGKIIDPIAERPSRYPSIPGIGEIVSNMRYNVIQRVTRSLTLSRGFEDDTSRTTYEGSPERIYTRFKGTFERRAGFNLTLEKDPGEVFEWAPETGTYAYDHITGHVFLRDYGRIRSFVVGDFVANFGQGLGLWQSSATGKSRESTSSVVRSGRGITRYGSTDENNFFRGAGGTLMITPSIAVSSFFSRRTLDASLIEQDTTSGFDDEFAISSLSTTGLHRTSSEIGRKDALRESIIGGAFEYASTRVALGAAGYRSQFDQPLLKGDRADELFEFSGKESTMTSMYGRAFFSDYSVFGELARDDAGTVAGVGGVTASAGRAASVVILARHYPRDFISLHADAFGERSSTSANESGLYVGVQVVPSRTIRINAYFDQYTFPWARFGVPRPSNGYEALLYIQHKPRRWLSHYLQFKNETKETGSPFLQDSGIELDGVLDETRQSLRWHLDYDFSKSLKTRTRTEGVRFMSPSTDDEFGFLLYQDVRWVAHSRVILDGRLMFFDTDSFDARLFSYEYDLRYTFAVPAFSGQGQRAYIMAALEPSRGVLFQVKHGVTRYEDKVNVGSGLDEVDGNTLRELRLQLFWRF